MAGFHGHRGARPSVDLGDEDPLYIRHIAKGPPDRRRVSLRWLTGSVLTGIFSAVLVGGALQAAVGIDEALIVRPALAGTPPPASDGKVAAKGDRYRPVADETVVRRVIQVSTVTKSDDRDLVRVRPFAYVRSALAHPVEEEIAGKVPDFDPVAIFAGDEEPPQETAVAETIYSADVDGEVAIKTIDFPVAGAAYDEGAEMEIAEVERRVREAAPFLSDGTVEVASLPFVDPGRFDYQTAGSSAISSLAIAVTPENVSAIQKSADPLADLDIDDKVLTVAEGQALKKLLAAEGSTDDEASAIQAALVANFSFDFRAGQKLLLGLSEDDEGRTRPVRVSLYDGDSHLATVALSDHGGYVAASAPALDDGDLFDVAEAPKPASGKMPTVFAGLWRTGLSLGMSEEMVEDLVRIFSYDVDFQARTTPTDNLEVIYSAEDALGDGGEILFVSLEQGGTTRRLYRYRSPEDGTIGYYDEDGRAAQKFLMRKPVTAGRFSSSFGMRKHPILGRLKLHSGVDWAAPRGTPIMAAGDGTVAELGRRSGYGNSITLKHANGYETTYNHMSGYAKSLKAGQRVHQGQVIGYVGSTGLSTGNHLHFEVLVNDRFVDPMKIRLPRGHELSGSALAAFEKERLRIDALLDRDSGRDFAAAALPGRS